MAPELRRPRPWWSRSGAPGRWRGLGVGEVLDLAGSASAVTRVGGGRSRSAGGRASTSEPCCFTCVAEHLAQRPVQDVGAGVVAADGVAALDVDRGRGLLAGLDRALDDPREVAVQARAGRRWCRAPRPCRCRCVMVPVSPTWPPPSA